MPHNLVREVRLAHVETLAKMVDLRLFDFFGVTVAEVRILQQSISCCLVLGELLLTTT